MVLVVVMVVVYVGNGCVRGSGGVCGVNEGVS